RQQNHWKKRSKNNPYSFQYTKTHSSSFPDSSYPLPLPIFFSKSMKTRALFLFHLFLLLLWQAPESHLVCTTIPHSLILSSQKVGNSNRRSRTITKLTEIPDLIPIEDFGHMLKLQLQRMKIPIKLHQN
ncbi:hypothetical protein E1A91_D07G174700v1, partial [Gossypium mustelinum]